MGFDEWAAFFLALAAMLAYCIMHFRSLKPFLRQAHNISNLKERCDFVQTTAEIVDIEQRDLNGLKMDICKLYVMRVRYTTENAMRGVEHMDIIFT